MASPSLTYTLTNGTTASASEVMQNFSDLLNGITDGTKDLSISALTCAGTVTLNGNTTIGNAGSDTLTVNAAATFGGGVTLSSSIIPSSDGAVDIGSATYGLRALYLGDASGDTVKIIPATLSADRIYTLPEVSADASFVMTAGTQTVGGAKTFSSLLTFGAAGSANISTGGLVIGGTTAAGSTTPTLSGRDVAVSSGGSYLIGPNTLYGMLFVGCSSTGESAIYFLNGGNQTTNEISDPAGVYHNADSTSDYRIYYSVPDSRYILKNSNASSRNFRMIFMSFSSTNAMIA